MKHQPGLPLAVLFDLDGTLVDSAPDIAAATNQLLRDYNLDEVSLEIVHTLIGDGVRKLVERAFVFRDQTLSTEQLDQCHSRMMEVYGLHLTNLSQPYPGVSNLLQLLENRGRRCAVVTNKPEAFAREIITHFGWNDHFAHIIGGDTLPTRKPDPGPLLHACRKLGVTPSETIMVGDGSADIQAAKNAGMRSVCVRGGYTQIPVSELGADIVVDDFSKLDAVLGLLPDR